MGASNVGLSPPFQEPWLDRGTADTLTPLLEGLDAAELMSLAPPDACHRVISDPEDPATAALRRELAGLRLTALQQRAVAEGLAPAALPTTSAICSARSDWARTRRRSARRRF